MHILILGAGALGSLVGARLSCTRARVSLLTTNRLHMEAIQRRGLVIEELDERFTRYELPAFSEPDAIPGKADWVLVTVKTYATEAAVTGVLPFCSDSTLFLTLQNGVGNYERISQIVGEASTLVGVTAQGATLVEPGKVRHGGDGLTVLGEFAGEPSSRVRSLVDCFLEAGLKTEAGGNMQQLIWQKLMVNVGINAITALTGIRNGGIHSFPDARDLSRAAVEEAVAVAERKGFRFAEDMVQRVYAVAEATSRNRSSMGQDIDRGRPTEIDAINGAVVGYGRELGLAVPVNETLTRLVRILQSNR